MRVQECRNGCGADIVLKEDQGKWKPYDYDEQAGDAFKLHNCPNSDYNQKKTGGGVGYGGRQTPPKETSYVRKAPTLQPKPYNPGSWRDQESTATTFTTPTDIPKHTEGGMVLDTKRLLTSVVELSKEFQSFRQEVHLQFKSITDKIEQNTQIDTNKLIGQLQQIHDVIAPFLGTQLKAASEIYKAEETPEQKYAREQDEVKNWDKKIPDDDSYKNEDSSMEGVQED